MIDQSLNAAPESPLSFPRHFLARAHRLPSLSSPRTESVAEKMLTNWFTFLLYKFLKVKLSIPAEMHKSFEALLIPAAVLGV